MAAKPKKVRRPPADDFIIVRGDKNMKPPTKKEIDAMRQRQIIRKNPRGTA